MDLSMIGGGWAATLPYNIKSLGVTVVVDWW